ncbi:MAG TPA: ATP-binding protein [Bryobacteraceae bacterium]|nr:ATP-binding protein [Bryobacteraceae bacterium]
MREFAIDLLESQGIAFELRAPQKYQYMVLSLESRRQLFLIFKECIHNAARHSQCTQVMAEFLVSGQEVLLRVQDNGRGLNGNGTAPRSQGGNGIPGMRRRADSLGGQIAWSTSLGGGCTVEARIPIRQSTFGKRAL